MSKMNRLALVTNPYQGGTKRVLCVCSAGLLRSPTAAIVLSQPPFNFNTRAAGVAQEYALIPVDDVLLYWADEIVCMEAWHCTEIYAMLHKLAMNKPVINLNVEDSYMYRDPQLMKEIARAYNGETDDGRSATSGTDDGGHATEASDPANGSTEAL